MRKTLTSQLLDLRQEHGPREQELAAMAARLREVECEYEHSLHALTEKENALAAMSATIRRLQRQNQDLRGKTAKKDQMLGRASVQLVELKLAFKHAKLDASRKAAVPPSTGKRATENPTASDASEILICLERLDEILAISRSDEADLDAVKVNITVVSGLTLHLAVLIR